MHFCRTVECITSGLQLCLHCLSVFSIIQPNPLISPPSPLPRPSGEGFRSISPLALPSRRQTTPGQTLGPHRLQAGGTAWAKWPDISASLPCPVASSGHGFASRALMTEAENRLLRGWGGGVWGSRTYLKRLSRCADLLREENSFPPGLLCSPFPLPDLSATLLSLPWTPFSRAPLRPVVNSNVYPCTPCEAQVEARANPHPTRHAPQTHAATT